METEGVWGRRQCLGPEARDLGTGLCYRLVEGRGPCSRPSGLQFPHLSSEGLASMAREALPSLIV